MAQNPLAATIAKTPTNVQTTLKTDTNGALRVTEGGVSSALALAAGVNLVKATPGRAIRLSVTTTGTAATLAVNDAASTGAVAAGNLVYQLAGASATEGLVVVLDWPCANGIVVTVPTSAVVSVAYA